MEYDFNANMSGNDQSIESEGDSITIDNNDYEDYTDEINQEENNNQGNQIESKKGQNQKGKKKNGHKQKNKKSQQGEKSQKNNKGMQLDNNDDEYHDEDEPLKAELQEKLHKVFLNYSKFNIQEENFILSHQYFMKMMRDCGLLREKYEKPKDNTLTAEQIDITLKKVCPKSASLNTQQFIDFFVTLAQRLYPNEFNKAPRNIVQQIVDHFLDPIVEYINEDQEGKFRYNKVEQSIQTTAGEGIDEKTDKIMKSMYPGLLNAYKLYFPQEYNYKGIPKEKIIKESLKSLTNFNIDFDLCTPFLTREKLAIYYNCIYFLKQKNLVFSDKKKKNENNEEDEEEETEGKIFTFDKFAFYLLCLANDVIPDDQFPKQWQKVSRLIKYLSDSNGEETMIKKFGAKITDDKGIYLDDQLIKELIKEDEEAKRLQIQKESPDGVLSNEEKNIIEKLFLNQANKDKMTQGKLTITPYFNILKELGIFDIEKENGELVNRKDAEMALTQVSRKKNINSMPNATYRNHNSLERNTNKVISKLDFDMFIKSLQELSVRIYPSLKKNEAFEKLMHEQINLSGLDITSDNDKIIETYNEIIQREETENDFTDILDEFKPIFKEIFDNYKDMHKDTISWQNFLIFCKDFNIISNNINLTDCNSVFSGLSKKYTKDKGMPDTGLIDFNFFFYSIGIFALKANNGEEDENNLISLLLAMLPSIGIQRPRDNGKGMYITYQNKLRDKLRELKKIYPTYFNNGEPDEIKVTSFNKIFSM